MYPNYQRLGTLHLPQSATRVAERGFQILETAIDARAAANKPLITGCTAREPGKSLLLYLSLEHLNDACEHVKMLVNT
jgi:hypothetical protein